METSIDTSDTGTDSRPSSELGSTVDHDNSDKEREQIDDKQTVKLRKSERTSNHSDKRKSSRIMAQTITRKAKKKSKRTANGYVCDQCQPNRYFKKSHVLAQHKTVLHGVSPKPCLWCGKQFFNESQLLVHQTLYAHNKPID